MILLYHKIDLVNRNHWYVSLDRFDYQMSCLRSKKVVHLDDYNPEDPNHVVITFDGIYENVWRYAAPIINKWGYPYELFVIGDYIGADNAFDVGQPLERFASREMLLDMTKRGARLQWHSATHAPLQNLAGAALERELFVPEELRQPVGPEHFQWFAYPHDVDKEERAAAAVRERFVGALACVAGDATDRYRLNRTTVEERTTLPSSTVSIVVANFNYGAYLPEAIDSVLRQTHSPDEFIIIDDASNDGSSEILSSYGTRARIIINETNLGIVGNFRKAVEATSGDYIGFLGADNRMRSDYVERTKAALDAAPDAAIAYTDMTIFGPLAPVLAAKVGATELSAKGIYLRQFPEPTPEQLASIEKRNFIHGSSVFRRSWYDRVGGYVQSDVAEDWHLFRRMIQSGGRAVRIPHPLLEYRQHSTAQANNVLGLQHHIAALTRELKELRGSRQPAGAMAPLMVLGPASFALRVRPATQMQWEGADLVIKAENNDPGFFVDLPDLSHAAIMLSLELETACATLAQFFSQTVEEAAVAATSQVRRWLEPGPNLLAIEFRRNAPIRRIRVDPGSEAGQYRLRAITVLAPTGTGI